MECHICQVRSSIGYCVECQGLLCETCGVPCDQCGKLSCPSHVHATRGGRELCGSCYADRKAKREQVKAAVAHRREAAEEDTSLAGLEQQPEGEISNEALVASARQPLQPWQMSLYIAGAGVALGIMILLFPGLRHIPLGGPTMIPTGYVLFVFPLLGIVWGIIGFVKEEYFKDRFKCLVGLGVSMAAVLVAFSAVWAGQSVRVEAPLPREVLRRTEDMTTEQLQQWRERALQKYQR